MYGAGINADTNWSGNVFGYRNEGGKWKLPCGEHKLDGRDSS
jgi:hypothetical protein